MQWCFSIEFVLEFITVTVHTLSSFSAGAVILEMMVSAHSYNYECIAA